MRGGVKIEIREIRTKEEGKVQLCRLVAADVYSAAVATVLSCCPFHACDKFLLLCNWGREDARTFFKGNVEILGNHGKIGSELAPFRHLVPTQALECA